MLQPCILEPTRIVNHQNPALIDNIFINIVEKNVKSGNLTSSISDHLPNYVIISDLIDHSPKTKHKVRNFNKFEIKDYQKDVENINLLHYNPEDEFTTDKLDTIYNDLQDKLTTTIDKHAPFKIQSKQEIKWKQSPWINKGIQKLIKIKDVFYRKYLRSKSTFWFNRFKYYRNWIKRLIFIAKK